MTVPATSVSALLWIPRVMLFVVMVPHGLGKFIAMSTFMDKFDLGPVVTSLSGIAEPAGAVGVVLGGVRMLPEPYRMLLTRLGVLAIAIVQVGAIIGYHWGRFFYFVDPPGMEFNLVLLALCLMLVLGHRSVRAVP